MSTRFTPCCASEYDTSIVPGRWFEMPDHFRLGLGGRPRLLEEGLERLGAALDALRMKKAEIAEFFRRLADRIPEPETELEYVQRLYPAGRGRPVGPGDRRRRQPRDARPVRGR